MFNRMKKEQNSMPTSRRGFLKLVAGSSAGLVLAMNLPGANASEEKAPVSVSDDGKFQPNAFVKIGADNKVYVAIKHLEMGQGTYTGLATLVAEELDASWDQVISEGAPTDTAKYKNLLWGAMGTGGSSAIANSFEQMRMAGATARAMLVNAAAEQWKVPVDQITVSEGVVSHTGSNRSATFGELAEAAAQQPVPAYENLTVKKPADFKLIGRKVSRKDLGKTDGTAIFTQDIKLDGMLTAMVAHPPRFGAKLKAFDASQTKQVKGVVDVIGIPSGVAVLANDYWSAKKGRDRLKIEWDESQAMNKSSAELMAEYKALAKTPGAVARNDGDTDSALANAATVIEADFEFPYLAHATMEPMNCVAQVREDGCEIWNGEQLNTGDQAVVAQMLGFKPKQVTINMLFAGGSFGRRANPHSDYVVETVNIAKAKPGVPVKLVWSREDDTQAGYFRPMYYHTIRGGLDANGNLIGWEQRIVGQSILTGTAFEAFLVKDGIDATSVEGASTLPYAIPNLKVDLHTVSVPVPVQWWRSVGHTHTAFSTEVFIDRVAKATGKDAVEMRLELLKGHPRHQGVLKLAAEKAGWGRTLPEGRALGVAVHESFNSYVAQVAEVSLTRAGGFKVEKVWCAVDCGFAVNPDVIKAQMEGGIGYGLSPVLMSEITIDNGAVQQSNFHDYQVLRINEMPDVEVHIVPSAEAPTGVGEPGTPPIAPAVANALYALTGQEFNKLPLKLV
ncbi:xanthine dehydrogenase family protein molybdopterin-binding subunit [Pontibacterium granulatum]|uniref:xanthine dehydrogenase family protein molybdopterin-binding subunit n=1 Tax=Pontibacterium granulatum TaxID=2036029 RepID=UPI00249ACEDF|nr:xanthine dehydrogenase family protein molybdopterin-binding subunit [Pontibacterium granulatum]MDI3324066.1 xanthine dehydrogenase family protein molybdopterin-binding subunit [Pontibacterium granulatum]